MIQQLSPALQIDYPDSDGQPMADNTLQFQWIVTLKENLELQFSDRADVFVAGDLLWYPVEGSNQIRRAPDVLVALGRPKGKRGSYRQWQEDNITPQVVFEVLSPGNTLAEMALKWQFYDRYGVEEYYLYDPDKNDLTGWQRQENKLTVISDVDHWQSPLLGIRWQLTSETWQIFRATGEPFFTFLELDQRYQLEKRRAEQESLRAEQESLRAEQESLRAEQESLRAEQEKSRADNEKVRADNAEAELNRLRELLSAQRINLDENS